MEPGPLASHISGRSGYAKGSVAYTIDSSHDSGYGLIPAGNMLRLQADHSMSSLANSLA